MFASLPYLQLFFVLCIGHFLADYPLQGDFLSKGKNRQLPLPGVPWYWCLLGHAAIHGGFVWGITGLWQLGLAEFLVHMVIDDMKCAGMIDFDVDQVLHILFKMSWTSFVFIMLHQHA